jgi:predicted transcriptional regulator of viral defense system
MKKRPIEIFRKNGGQLRMSEAIAHGITRYMLYSLRDKGIIEQVSRGVYRLVELAPLSNPDLVTVSLRYPNAVICLISALSYHNITTQIPHAVSVAVPRESRVPSLDYPPIRAHRFSYEAYTSGIENHTVDGVPVKIYTPEKTLADCFKFRNKVGLDTVVEAIRFYRERRSIKVDDLMRYAKICRVKRLMRPYLEAIL